MIYVVCMNVLHVFVYIRYVSRKLVYVFIYFLFVVFHPTIEFFFTFTHMDMSPLPVKDCIFWSMLGTYSHWAVRVSLEWHTYCDTRHPFKMVVSKDPWHWHLMPSVWQWSCHYLFWWLRSVTAGIWTSNLLLAAVSV